MGTRSAILQGILFFLLFPPIGWALALISCGPGAFSVVEHIAALIIPFVGLYLFWMC